MRKYSDHPRPPFQFLVLPLQHIGRAHPLLVRLRQRIDAQYLFAVLLRSEEGLRSPSSSVSTPGSAAPAYWSCASAFGAPPAAHRRPVSLRRAPPAAAPPWEPSSPTPRWPLQAPSWPPGALPTRSPASSAAAPVDAAAGRTTPARCAQNAPGSVATPRLENASRWLAPCRHDRRSPHSARPAARAASTPRRPRPNWPPTPTRPPSSPTLHDNPRRRCRSPPARPGSPPSRRAEPSHSARRRSDTDTLR